MIGAKPLRQTADHRMVFAALARRVDLLRPDLEMHLAARGIEIVMLDHHGRRQHDIGQLAPYRS